MEQTQPERFVPARGDAGQSDAFRFPMPLMCTPFKPGTLDEVLLSLPGDDYGALRVPRRPISAGAPRRPCDWPNRFFRPTTSAFACPPA